jgi:outer membrane murein-binding lipoprotein Lpp
MTAIGLKAKSTDVRSLRSKADPLEEDVDQLFLGINEGSADSRARKALTVCDRQ